MTTTDTPPRGLKTRTDDLPPSLVTPTDAELEALAPDRVATGKKPEPRSEVRGGGLVGEHATTPEMRSMQRESDAGLKDYLKTVLGDSVDFKISVSRREPQTFYDGVRDVPCGGHLHTYTEFIDEEFIKARHGGGRFTLKVNRPKANGTGSTLAAQRDIMIAGDPRIDNLPKQPPSAANTPAGQPAPAPSKDDPKLVTEVFGFMKDEIRNARDNARPYDPSSSTDAIRAAVAPLEASIQRLTTMLEAKDKTIVELQNRPPPPEDRFKTELMTKLINDDTSRMANLRMAHEAEINALKTNHATDITRVRDQAERDRDNDRRSFDRERQVLVDSHARELAALKSSMDMQIKLLESEQRKTDRDNTEIRAELKEVKAKKDKTLLEQAKDINDLKEALGVDDNDKGGTVERLVGLVTDPDGLKAVGAVVDSVRGKPNAAAQAAAAAAAAQAAATPQKPRVVKDVKTGEAFVEHEGQLIPAKKRTGPPAGSAKPQAKGEPEIPALDEGLVKDAVNKLEIALYNNIAPEQAAELARDSVPVEVIKAIREHGVDVFMAKVAKLQSNSPLATQAGKVWCRKFGKALIGE